MRTGGLGCGVNGLFSLAKQPLFDLGLFLYAVTTLVWIKVISVEPLSVAYPVLTSITFLLVTLAAAFFLHEGIAFQKIIGLIVILVGIVLVGRG